MATISSCHRPTRASTPGEAATADREDGGAPAAAPAEPAAPEEPEPPAADEPAELAVDESSEPAATGAVYTMDDVAEHSSRDDCW